VLFGAGVYWLAYLRPRQAARRVAETDGASLEHERDLHLKALSSPP
jgi:hypothetical protein